MGALSMIGPMEGQRVSYVGDGVDGLSVGDQGKVLSADGHASHVLWSTGSRAGEVILTDHLDLVTNQKSATYDDLQTGGLVTFSVRSVYDREGPTGLLNSLNEEGHMATFTPIAEDAIQMVAGRIRQDPSFQEVLARLDDEEGDHLVELAASVLLRDAFGGPDEDL